MSATAQFKSLVESIKADMTEDFWLHIDKVENVLRRVMPLVPFNYPKTSRVHFSWDGRSVVHAGLSLPVPSPAELESALDKLLDKALGVMALVDGNVAPAGVVEAGKEGKTTENRDGTAEAAGSSNDSTATAGGSRVES